MAIRYLVLGKYELSWSGGFVVLHVIIIFY